MRAQAPPLSFLTSQEHKEMKKSGQRYLIRAVERALELLKVFSTTEPELSLTELSNRLGLNPSTAYRLLTTLESHGFVEQNSQNGRYHLGVACLHLGSVFLSQASLRQQALPLLETLRNDCKETVHLTILDRMEVVYLEKLEGLLPIGFMSSRVGGRSPAYCTGVGKALLAYEAPAEVRSFFSEQGLKRYTENTIVDVEELLTDLAEVRNRGFAIDNEEHEIGVKCVAAPIRDHQGKVVGAISISGPVQRINERIAEMDLVSKVINTSTEISARLGYSPS
jgi:DNA-binding IclR family transcriptional regulator